MTSLGELLKQVFNPLIIAVIALFNPMVAIIMSVTSIVAVLITCVSSPQSAVNQLICTVIDMVSGFLPSTPDNLKLGSILNQATSTMPNLGRGIIGEIFLTTSAIFGITIAIKIYKLIPFKAT